MQVAFEIADGALARRVVAEGDVDVGIDQARDRGGPVGVDDDVRALHLARADGADGNDPAFVHEDRVAVDERRMPVARDDAADIDDRGAHVQWRAASRSPSRS